MIVTLGIINIWDLTSGRCLDSLEQCDQGYVDLQYCPSINTLVGVASDQTLTLYSLDNRDDIKFVSILKIISSVFVL